MTDTAPEVMSCPLYKECLLWQSTVKAAGNSNYRLAKDLALQAGPSETGYRSSGIPVLNSRPTHLSGCASLRMD